MYHQNDGQTPNTGTLHANPLKHHELRSAAFELIDNSKIGIVKHLHGKG
jgi:hypothetical protein